MNDDRDARVTRGGRSRLLALARAHLRDNRGALAVAAIALIGSIAAELAAPWPIKLVFDHVLLGHPLPDALAPLAPLFALGTVPVLGVLAAGVFLLVLVGGGFAYLQLFITARIGHELTYRLRRELFDAIQRMPLARHRRGGSELLVRFAADTAAIKDLVADWALTIASHVVLVTGMLAIMFMLNWRLALLVGASIPVLGGVLAVLNLRIRRSLASQRRQEGRMAARVGEVLSAIAVVQAFGRMSDEAERFEATSARNLAESIRASRTTAAVAKAIALVSAAVTALTLLVGAWQVLEGAMSPGGLLVFMAYLRSLYKPLRNLGKLSVKVSRALVSADRIADVLDEMPATPAAAPGGHVPVRLDGAIELDRVSYVRPDGRKLLDGVSLEIAPGETVAIAGPSGAGKSTLVSLILGLDRPSSGTIRIDGRALGEYRPEALRQRIGVVLQDTVLFGASLRENIAYGKPEATDDEVREAARDAHAAGFIERQADGYATVLDDDGIALSGGERQRVCLARALIKRPDVLVLDEPTAAVDAVSARLIRDAVRRVQAGKTTLVIAHDLGAHWHFDRIFVLADGRLVESGTHGELMRSDGRYRELLAG